MQHSIDSRDEQNERILCSAIWYKELPLRKTFEHNVRPVNCDYGVVFCGFRHTHCMYTMSSVTGLRTVTNAADGVGEFEQGFLTSRNRFVGREEAAEIAVREGQIRAGVRLRSSGLYSEDLY